MKSSLEMKRTLVIGSRGFLGRHLFQHFQKQDPNCIGTHNIPIEGLWQLNLKNPIPDLQALPLKGYSYALIAAGISSPVKCEADPRESWLINVDGILATCRFFMENKIQPILISSGHVFDGEKGAYIEDDPYSPINAYGRQKVELEQRAVEEFRNECLIIRIAKIFGFTKSDQTLIDEIAGLLFQKKEVLAAKDQVLSPVSLDDVVQCIVALQTKGCRGIYHLGSIESVTRYELARMIADKLNIDDFYIKPIALENLKAPFPRPKRSDLVPNKLLSHTNVRISDLKENVKRVVSNYI